MTIFGGTPQALVIILGWFLVVLYLFSQFPPHRAMIISFVVGWMFLPRTEILLPLIPDYNKISATGYAALLGTMLFHPDEFGKIRYHWIDVPMTIWCISPFFSSLVNNLGAYDGFNMALNTTVIWGVPYLLGRLLLRDLQKVREFAYAILLGGFVQVPLVLYESRMMTDLHTVIYGFGLTGEYFLQSLRLGGYRPSVFTVHGLMFSMWFLLATVLAFVFWRTKSLKQVWGFIPGWLVISLMLFAFVLLRSTGAYTLFLLALGLLFLGRWLKIHFTIYILVAAIVVYLFLGASDLFPDDEILSLLRPVFSEERIHSLEFRFKNEDVLAEKAMEAPMNNLFGWGGFGRNRVYDSYTGEDITVTDSLWIIVYGVNGIIGLITCFGSMLLPILMFCVRYPARLWSYPIVAPSAGLAVCLLMYVIDCVLNAMVNPVFIIASGSLASVAVMPLAKRPRGVAIAPVPVAPKTRSPAGLSPPAPERGA